MLYLRKPAVLYIRKIPLLRQGEHMVKTRGAVQVMSIAAESMCYMLHPSVLRTFAGSSLDVPPITTGKRKFS